jgi:beta-1,4-mannosyltransferase
MEQTSRPLDVLYSFGPPAEDANPYVHLLLDAVSSGATVHYFSWKFALLGKYDAFHVHWPETLLRRPTLKGRVACRVFLSLLLAKLAVTRTPIIRTEHNLRPHESGDRIENAILNLLDRRAAAWVVMNNNSEQPAHKLHHIPHGHYRDWYEVPASADRKPGRLLNFGLIRPYKGVEDLVEAFKDLPESSGLELSIMGNPQTPEAGDALREVVGATPGITTDLRHVPAEDLAAAVAEASLVVLPYRAMHNSGALLLALSLGTPVLVPKNEMTDALAAEVGEQWVQRFEGPITAETLVSASTATEAIEGTPDLSRREWPEIGRMHVRTYRLAAA